MVHADTDDARGIDVAFVYDDTLLHVPLPVEESVYFHVVMRRHATREIVQVNFKTTTAAAQTWAVFGNHGHSSRMFVRCTWVPPTSPPIASCRRADSAQRWRKPWGPYVGPHGSTEGAATGLRSPGRRA